MTVDGHASDSSRPRARGDLLIRQFDNEAVAWSPIALAPVHLGALGTVMLQLLDGDVSIGELITDVCAVFELEEGVGRHLVRHEMSHLDGAGMLTTSVPSSAPEPGVFSASWNP